MAREIDLEGGCYCGAVRYHLRGEPLWKAQCHCRACQYISGGGPNFFLLMGVDDLTWKAAEPARFARADLEVARTRRFCATCGTHLTTELPDGERLVVKVGTLDDPAAYGGPKAAIHMAKGQDFQVVAPNVPCFNGLP